MNPHEKLTLQYIVTQKSLDVIESLSLIKADWVFTAGDTDSGMKIKGQTHTARDIRLCCYDLRALYLPNDPLHYKKIGSLAGPLRKKGNKTLREAGLRMLERVAPLENSTDPLKLPNIPVHHLDENGVMFTREAEGYLHSPRYVATAYLYGQWAHSTRASDLLEMASGMGSDMHNVSLARFTFTAGHGLLAVAMSMCSELVGEDMPVLEGKVEVEVGFDWASRTLKEGAQVLAKKLEKLEAKERAKDPQHTRPAHVWPIMP